jgi:PAS domain S-box-containing protein
VDVISAMAALDFTKAAMVGEEGTALDALSFGLNTLREELAASMVSKDYVENILDSMNDALIVLDRDQTIMTANHAAARLFGYPKEDLIGKPARVLFEQEELAARLAQTIARGQSVINQETTCRTSDGQIVPSLYLPQPCMIPTAASRVSCVSSKTSLSASEPRRQRVRAWPKRNHPRAEYDAAGTLHTVDTDQRHRPGHAADWFVGFAPGIAGT